MRPSGTRAAASARGLFLLCLLAGPGGATLRADSQTLPPLSYAFARHVGSGIYSVQGRPVQIYSMPFSVTVRSLEQRRWGMKVTLPFTVGFYDFKASDVLETGLPERIGTLSLVPGVRFDVAVTEAWTLSPFAELGAAKDMEGDGVVAVSGLGVASEYRFPLGHLRGRLANQILGAGSRDLDTEVVESYGELRNGFELGVPLRLTIRGHGTEIAPFVSNYLYFKPPDDFLAPLRTTASETTPIHSQWEVGLTFGTRETWKLWKIPLPRVGLSYRFGDGPEVVRFVLGSPF